MELSAVQFNGTLQIIGEASKTPLAVVVLLAVLVSQLSITYFGKGRGQKDGRLLKYRFAVFVLVLLGALGTGMRVISFQPGIAQGGGSQTPKQPINMQKPLDQPNRHSSSAKNEVKLAATHEFASQIERARKYSRLTDYAHACEIYAAAFGFLPVAVLSDFDHEAVSTESKKCGKGRSQEAVERLDGIAARFTVD